MNIDIVDLKLSVQRGLLGHVFPKLRAVCANSIQNRIIVCFYVDGEITEHEKELCECVLDDVTADFFLARADEKDQIEFEIPIIRLDYPKKPPLIGYWVYYRNEDTSKYINN
jgi:hypothetical protein